MAELGLAGAELSKDLCDGAGLDAPLEELRLIHYSTKHGAV